MASIGEPKHERSGQRSGKSNEDDIDCPDELFKNKAEVCKLTTLCFLQTMYNKEEKAKSEIFLTSSNLQAHTVVVKVARLQ